MFKIFFTRVLAAVVTAAAVVSSGHILLETGDNLAAENGDILTIE